MKKRCTEEQIIKAIKQHESGVKVEELCRELNISTSTLEIASTTRDKARFNASY